MKHISQAHLCGCMPASFAMVTGDHYYGSLSFFRKRNFDKKGVHIEEALEVFKELGYKVRWIKRVNLDKLDKDAILVVKSDGNENDLHAVAWDSEKKKVRDPARGTVFRHLTKEKYAQECTGAIVIG